MKTTLVLVFGMLGCAGTFAYHVLAEQKNILAAAETITPAAKERAISRLKELKAGPLRVVKKTITIGEDGQRKESISESEIPVEDATFNNKQNL